MAEGRQGGACSGEQGFCVERAGQEAQQELCYAEKEYALWRPPVSTTWLGQAGLRRRREEEIEAALGVVGVESEVMGSVLYALGGE